MGKSNREAVAELTKAELIRRFRLMPLEHQKKFPNYEQQLAKAKTSQEALIMSQPVHLIEL